MEGNFIPIGVNTRDVDNLAMTDENIAEALSLITQYHQVEVPQKVLLPLKFGGPYRRYTAH
jgi:hypothetical protein